MITVTIMKTFPTTLLLILLFINVQFRSSTSIEVRISPTCSGRISSCCTLTTLPKAYNLTLVLEPGVHEISSSAITLQNTQYLELKGNGQSTIHCTKSTRYSSNIRISSNSRVVISKLTFSGCRIEFSNTNNTVVNDTKFIDGKNGILEFSRCHNLTFDKSYFNSYSVNHFDQVIEFQTTTGIEITGCNFSNNSISSHALVMKFTDSHVVSIDKCYFNNNTVSHHGHIMKFSGSDEIDISFSEFYNNSVLSHADVLELSGCKNVSIDNSSFKSNNVTYHGQIIKLSGTIRTYISRSNFTNNCVSSHSEVIGSSNSTGTIGCTNFHSNSAGSFGGIVTLERGSVFYVSNSSFKNSTLSSFGGVIRLESTNDNVVVITSVFFNTEHRSFGGVINLYSSRSSATIIASKFINTWSSIRYSRHGAALYSNSLDVTIDCCEFSNTTIPMQYIHYNFSFCHNQNLDEPSTCENTLCSLADCQPPKVQISLDKSEYIVSEEIGKSSRALQVCAVAMDTPFKVEASLQIHNGSATENEDFISGSHDCRVLNFNRKTGTQKSCAYLRIVEDSMKEGNEQFYVSLESLDPTVNFKTKRATVMITEDKVKSACPEPTTEMPVQGLSKIALVECGQLRREITYTGGGNDLDNLRTAIVEAFGRLTGIQSGHIALFQVKSDQYGDFLDQPFHSPVILSNKTQVKVITYASFTCLPRYVPDV